MGSIINLFQSSYTPKVHLCSPDISVPVRKSGDSETTEQTSLRSLLETKCPSLFAEFRPAWWLPNGHLQTMYCVTGDFTKGDKVKYERKYLRLVDGGTLGLDFTPAVEQDADEKSPIIVVLHGLTGGSHESYVRAILAPACAPVKDGGLGYRGAVVNFRGCAGVPITSPQLYSAGYTDDIRQALMYIQKRYPQAPLIGVGFSLGANVMTRYIAEEGTESRLVAGCAMACPWDLAKNNIALNGSVVGRHVYSQGMGGNLLNLLKRHARSLTKSQNERVSQAVANGLTLKKPTMEAFDDTFTRVAGGSSPPFPFASAHEYYVWSSSHKVLPDIKVPFLAINAADDPIVQEVPKNTGGDSWATMVLTTTGGHLGWFEASSSGQIQRWVKKPVLEWLRVVGEDIVHDRTKGRQLVERDDGFLSEVGRDNLGCKEIDGIATGEGEVSGLLQGL